MVRSVSAGRPFPSAIPLWLFQHRDIASFIVSQLDSCADAKVLGGRGRARLSEMTIASRDQHDATRLYIGTLVRVAFTAILDDKYG